MEQNSLWARVFGGEVLSPFVQKWPPILLPHEVNMAVIYYARMVCLAHLAKDPMIYVSGVNGERASEFRPTLENGACEAFNELCCAHEDQWWILFVFGPSARWGMLISAPHELSIVSATSELLSRYVVLCGGDGALRRDFLDGVADGWNVDDEMRRKFLAMAGWNENA